MGVLIMDSKCLDKHAFTSPGELAARLYKKMVTLPSGGWKPLKTPQTEAVRVAWKHGKPSVPLEGGGTKPIAEALTADTARARAAQTQAVKNLVNILLGTAAAGGGLGLVRHVPKVLRAREELKPKEKRPEDREKEAALGDVFKEKVLPKLPKIDLSELITVSPPKGAPGPAAETDPGMWEALISRLRAALTGGPPESWLQARFGGMPAGMMVPAAIGAGAGGVLAGEHLADWMTDKLRAKQIEKRKKELQEEFAGLLASPPREKVSTLNRLIEHMAEGGLTTMDKDAQAHVPAGLLYSLLLALAGVGGMAGYRMSKGQHPYSAKRKALEMALQRRVQERPVRVELEPRAPEEVADVTPEAPETLAPGAYRTSLILPPQAQEEEVDEALDLSKLGMLLVKDAQDPVLGKPKGIVYGRGGRAMPGLTYDPSGRIVAGQPGIVPRATQAATEAIMATPKVKEMMQTADQAKQELAALKGMREQAQPLLERATSALEGWEKFKGGFMEGAGGIGNLLKSLPMVAMGLMRRGGQAAAPIFTGMSDAAARVPRAAEQAAASPAPAPAQQPPAQPILPTPPLPTASDAAAQQQMSKELGATAMRTQQTGTPVRTGKPPETKPLVAGS